MSENELLTSIWDHIEDLRITLVRILWVIGLGFIITFGFYPFLFDVFVAPLQMNKQLETQNLVKHTVLQERIFNPASHPIVFSLPPNAIVSLKSQAGVILISQDHYQIEPGYSFNYEKLNEHKLLILSPLEGVLMAFKLSFWSSLAFTSPVWVFILLKFLLPGLKNQEKRIIKPFILGSFFFLTLGLLFAYHVTIPLANQYLAHFNAGIGENFWTLSSYIDYTFVLLFGHATAFELCLLLLLLVHGGVLTASWLIDKRRYMIVSAFILGAILTPPDIPSQLMLTIPLIGVYELAILYARLRAFRQKTLFNANVD